MATIIAIRTSSVIENLHVVMGFIRAVCPADNVLSREQGKFLAGMVNDAIEEIEGYKKRIDHLEQYKAGWISTVNVVNENTPLLKEFDELDFVGVTEYIKSLSAPPTKKSDNTIDISFDIIDGYGRSLLAKLGNPDQKNVNADKREAIALQAMHALIIAGLNTDAWNDYEDLVSSAYAIAEEFLEANGGAL
ncbi:TPA: hypothetical protein ACKP1B_001485 [Serratia fonticola]